MREQRVVLEDGVDAAPVRRDALGGLAEQADVAGVGCSKPEISRRQVVLPEPEGPSMAKNAALRRSRGRRRRRRATAPKPGRRRRPSNSTGEAARGRCASAAPARSSRAADHADVVGDPAVVGHALCPARRPRPAWSRSGCARSRPSRWSCSPRRSACRGRRCRRPAPPGSRRTRPRGRSAGWRRACAPSRGRRSSGAARRRAASWCRPSRWRPPRGSSRRPAASRTSAG